MAVSQGFNGLFGLDNLRDAVRLRTVELGHADGGESFIWRRSLQCGEPDNDRCGRSIGWRDDFKTKGPRLEIGDSPPITGEPNCKNGTSVDEEALEISNDRAHGVSS